MIVSIVQLSDAFYILRGFLLNSTAGIVIAYYLGTALVLQKARVGVIQSLIPLYQQYLFVEITMGDGIYIVGMFLPFVNLYVIMKTHYNLTIAFNKNKAWQIAGLLLPVVIVPLIGFDNSEYTGVPR